ncbi:CPBP family intramembrane glutamic endopeptidase [Ktedonospora formicarum]|uniref:Abortive infection protein n=1 Tax=Ktedonospora formicarum TaxID=2778364 RepID=A0A8J3HZP8_9CHLR|nr:CPBP family intramembrane glutamic endopeptidase [Ktedonospora formicarum]GHO47222.1 abortive infection protein [Ktedonospora formicarum]
MNEMHDSTTLPSGKDPFPSEPIQVSSPEEIPSLPAKRSHAKAFWFLLLCTAMSSLLIIPYTFALLGINNPSMSVITITTIAEIVQDVIFSAIGAGIGLWLGSGIGLGAPLLEDWLNGRREAARAFVKGLPLAFIIGLLAGIIVFILAALLSLVAPMKTSEPANLPSTWQGFLAAISAGIREEIWTRLGLLTLFAWLGTKIVRGGRLSASIFWIANILAALIFASLHFTNAAIIGASGVAMVLNILLLNSIVGLTFGWVYWKRGILLAMVAHFACDIILHVIPPLLVGKF